MSNIKKYSPQSLSEVIYPNIATERRITAFANGLLTGHLMLHGPNGTGKSTIARLLPIAMDGISASIEPLDADDLLSQDDIKSYLARSIQLAKLGGLKRHFVVLNEFDKTSASRFDNFWRAMDDLGSELVVIITSNEPMNIHRSIRSRCIDVEMPAITASAFQSTAKKLLTAQGLALPDQQLLHYLKSKEYAGDLRKYLSLLDELLYLHNAALPMPAWQKKQPNLKVVTSK